MGELKAHTFLVCASYAGPRLPLARRALRNDNPPVLKSILKRAGAALESETGDNFAAVRLARRAARRVRDELREPPRLTPDDGASTPAPVQAPAVLYFIERQWREVERIKEILDGRGIEYRSCDLTEDEASREAVLRDAGGRHLPILFVAGTAIGGAQELANLEARSELDSLFFGASKPRAESPVDDSLADSAIPAQVYGPRSCSWSGRAVRLLEDRGIEHRFVDLDEPQHVGLKERLARETEQRTAPYIFLRGEFVGGHNKLDEIDRLGLLDEKTRATSAPTRGTKIVMNHGREHGRGQKRGS